MALPRINGLTRNLLAGGALVLAGFGGGAILAATGTADATTGAAGSTSSAPGGHAGETPLTGTTAAKVKAAALAKYPGATVDRVETDSDGVYEAHLTTKTSDHVTVQVDKSFAVTGTQTGGGPGGDHGGPRGPGGPGGHGDETPLTGTTAAKVKAAALAKYPGATVDRVETDFDGVYEAHVTTGAGVHVTVHVDKSFTVTGTKNGVPRDHADQDGTSSSSWSAS